MPRAKKKSLPKKKPAKPRKKPAVRKNKKDIIPEVIFDSKVNSTESLFISAPEPKKIEEPLPDKPIEFADVKPAPVEKKKFSWKKFFSFRNRFFSIIAAIVFAGLFCTTVYVFAVPPDSSYSPGATLNPSCTAGSTNCSVYIPFSIDGSNNVTVTATGTDMVFNTSGSGSPNLLSDNGIITFGGNGGSYNENLSLDFETTANTVGFSSSTAVTNLNFGSLKITTTGTGTFGYIVDSGLTASKMVLTDASKQLVSGVTFPSTVTQGDVIAAASNNILAAVGSTTGTKYLRNTNGSVSWETLSTLSSSGSSGAVQYSNGSGGLSGGDSFVYNPESGGLYAAEGFSTYDSDTTAMVTGSTADVTAGAFTTLNFHGGILTGVSTAYDEKLLKDIAEIGPVLDKIANIRVATYKWNEQGLAQFQNPQNNENKVILGFVANDIAENFPEAAFTENKNGVEYQNYNYVYLNAITFKAIQELNVKVNQLASNGTVNSGQVQGIDIKSALSSLGMALADGVGYVREFAAETFSAKTARLEKLEMVDKATGEIYCTWIENGEWQKFKGDCSTANQAVVAQAEPAQQEQPQPEQPQEQAAVEPQVEAPAETPVETPAEQAPPGQEKKAEEQPTQEQQPAEEKKNDKEEPPMAGTGDVLKKGAAGLLNGVYDFSKWLLNAFFKKTSSFVPQTIKNSTASLSSRAVNLMSQDIGQLSSSINNLPWPAK